VRERKIECAIVFVCVLGREKGERRENVRGREEAEGGREGGR